MQFCHCRQRASRRRVCLIDKTWLVDGFTTSMSTRNDQPRTTTAPPQDLSIPSLRRMDWKSEFCRSGYIYIYKLISLMDIRSCLIIKEWSWIFLEKKSLNPRICKICWLFRTYYLMTCLGSEVWALLSIFWQLNLINSWFLKLIFLPFRFFAWSAFGDT